MGNKVLVYPPGSVIVLTEGQYSDFCISSGLVTVKECDLTALKRQYALELQAKGREKDGKKSWASHYYGDLNNASADGFSAWLIVNGYAMPLSFSEVHVLYDIDIR